MTPSTIAASRSALIWSDTTRRLSRAWSKASASSWTSAGSTNHPPSSDRSSGAERSRSDAVVSRARRRGSGHRAESPRTPGASGRRWRVGCRARRAGPAPPRRAGRARGIAVDPRELLVLAQRVELSLEALARDRASRHLEDARLVVEDQRAEGTAPRRARPRRGATRRASRCRRCRTARRAPGSVPAGGRSRAAPARAARAAPRCRPERGG